MLLSILSILCSILWYGTIVGVLGYLALVAMCLYINDFPRRRKHCKSQVKLTGKTVIITGANSGVGLETAKDIAKRGAHLVMVCRNLVKAEKARNEIVDASGNDDVSVMQCDLSDLDSVQKFCKGFLEKEKSLDILINNAGVGSSEGLTKQKFDGTVGSNYVGPFVLTYHLLDKLKESESARIVNVSSMANYGCFSLPLEEVNSNGHKLPGMKTYNPSKLLNVLHAKELSRRLLGTGVTTYSLHPGYVNSGFLEGLKADYPLVYYMFYPLKRLGLTAIEGAQTSIFCAVDESVSTSSGKYYNNCREVEPNKLASDIDLCRRVWDVTEKVVQEYLQL